MRTRGRIAATAVLVGLVAVGGAGAARGDVVGGPQLASRHATAALLPGADPLPEVWAATWIIADATTGEVLAAKGAHVQRAPASTLKTLLALTVLPQTSPDQLVRATRKAAQADGSRVGLRIGRQYSLDDLWYAVFLPSANDAAIAVAQANGGVEHTVAQMNATARALGALDTVARTPNGLDRPGQLSSAYDLALIARAGLARTDFAHYAATAKATFPDAKGRARHAIWTTNRLLLHGYRGLIGVKTGFTSDAGRTYVGAARRHGHTLIVALMGIKEASETAARKLLDWGFANREAVAPIGTLVPPTPAEETVLASPVTTTGADTAPSPAVAAAATVAPSGHSEAVLWGGGLVVVAAVVGMMTALARRSRRSRRRGRHA